MTSKMRSFRNLRNPIGCLILLAAFAAAAGCSTAETTGGSATNMNHVLPSGSSVSGWMVTPSGGSHASTATLDYIAGNGSSGCAECHGSDLKGGISGVSCFTPASGCHHGPVPGWVAISPAAQQHGVSAKKAPGSSGFASCQICHGSDFSGGGANIRCSFCHVVNAPHPPGPWRGSPYSHTDTNTANAPVCAQCHYPGSPNNPANHPATPAPAGTAPGCFNSTLCHGEAAVPHPVGGLWFTFPPDPQPHGNAAKAVPSPSTGFAYCQVCHGSGTDFQGGTSGVSCFTSCHFVNDTPPLASPPYPPHPAAPWRASAGSAYTHTTTSEGNAAVCAYCHQSAAGTPGCFNNTLCHGAGGAPHPVPYNDNSHYAVTSATFPGSCSACHDVSAPSAKVGPVCQTCHVAASPLTAANCTSCHASPPSGGAGAAYANIAGAHGVHLALDNTGTPVSCDTCHTGLGPSLLNLNHYNRAKSRVPPGDVAFLATYNAETGASSFDNGAALSCSNVSCHGGVARSGGNPGTPLNWRTGSLTVNTACTSCHVSGTSQFNSYNSGEHTLHVNLFGAVSSTCTICHNTTTLAVNHFTNLGTPAMEGPASATIGGGTTTVTTYVPATTSCTPAPGCHQPPQTRNWIGN